VQALLSVQLPVLSAKVQPVCALQPSSVQTLPSAHGNAAPGWQALLAQVSPTVHRLPSSQEPETAAKLQPVVGLQLSAVQALLSLQLMGVPMQLPPLQTSLLVQAEPSLQVAVLAANWQPLLASQVSVVHGLLSPQTNAVPGWQEPPLHWSPWVHTLPSSQPAVLLVYWQPLPGLQLSVVHGLLSSQVRLPPALQLPARQASAVLQALPSSQLAVVGANAHPLVGSQLSAVQPLPSLQTKAVPPAQVPPLQASALVQALPSLQGIAAAMATQPLAGLHKSKVHGLLSSQGTAEPALQLPPLQTSFWVQALPS
jgi:hypothetical protein